MYPLFILSICLVGAIVAGVTDADRASVSTLVRVVGPVASLVLLPLSEALAMLVYFAGATVVGMAIPKLRDHLYWRPGADADADREGPAAIDRMVRCTSQAHACVLFVGFMLGCM